MRIVTFALENKELLRVIYTLFIVSLCAIIVLKTDRIFKLSDYQGLRYFRNAFFFYGIGWIILGILMDIQVSFPVQYSLILQVLYSFTTLTGSLFLLYSLTWKYFEKEKSHNSLFSPKSAVIYLLSLFLGIITLKRGVILEFFQIIIFFILLMISLHNQIKSKTKFTNYYVGGVLLSLFFWSLKAINRVINLDTLGDIIMYLLGSIFYIIFLVGILNSNKNKK